MYRLYFDIPLTEDQNESLAKARQIMESVVPVIQEAVFAAGMRGAGVRVGNDLDHTKKNYLKLTESGHATKTKTDLASLT